MRLLTSTALAVLFCLPLTGCLCTRHIDHTCSSNSSCDGDGHPTAETHVEHNERKWLGFWPLQPWRVEP
jgi:hypothetical protein